MFLKLMQHWEKFDSYGPQPEARSAHAAVCINYGEENPQVVLLGGSYKKNRTVFIFDDIWMLDVNSAKWKEVSLGIKKINTQHCIMIVSDL